MARTRTSTDITIVALTEINALVQGGIHRKSPTTLKRIGAVVDRALNEASDKARIKQLKMELKELKRRRYG